MAFIIIFVVSTEGQDYIRWLKGLRPDFADSMILNDKKENDEHNQRDKNTFET